MKSSTLQVMRIIWVALFISQIFYAIIAFSTLSNGQPFSTRGLTDFSDPVRVPLCMAAVMSLVASGVLPSFLLLSARKSRKTRAPMEFAEMSKAYMMPAILRFALLESVTLYGFALTQLKHDPVQILPFVGVALGAFTLNFPSEERIRAAFVDPT